MDFAPRFAFAYSPGAESGIMRKIFGGPGKSSIRGGYGIYYDHFGQGITNTFDRQGSFGLTTSLTNSAGIQDVDTVPRFNGLTDIPAALVQAPPSGGFPATPPAANFSITWGFDDQLKSRYWHVAN